MIDDQKYMAEAIKEAEIAANEGNWPMGCIIVLDDQIIVRSHNSGYTDENRLAHAEIKALTAAKELLELHRGEATLYTTYEPCPMCFGAIVLSKIKRVVTGVDLDSSGCLDMVSCLPDFFQQEKFKFEVTRGVMAEECKKVYFSGKMIEKHKESGFVKSN